MDRLDLCETLMKLCIRFGVDEVEEALAEVVDAISEDTGEFDAPSES